MQAVIYFDYAATTPMSEEVIDIYAQTARNIYGNASSLHDEGSRAKDCVATARKIIAAKLGVSTDGVIFTGSGTEGNIITIVSLARASGKRHIITTQAEHTSVHAAMNILQREGYTITKLPLQQNGSVSLIELEAAITHNTALISIQQVNSETGAVQPIKEIIQLATERSVLVHCDCVQSFGKITIPAGLDAMTISAHKIGGPKGCGAIYLNPRIKVTSLMPGVTHERGLRGGTLDTPAIIAFARAVQLFTYDIKYQQQLRDYFIANLAADFTVLTSTNQLPSIYGVISEKFEGQYIMLSANQYGFAISTGSACDIFNEDGTKAVQAMGYEKESARRFFRISTGAYTTIENVLNLAQTLNKVHG